MEIKLIKPSVWEEILTETIVGLSPRAARRVGAVIRTMHNRHVGITPRLAAGLALLAAGGNNHLRSASAQGAWSEVLKRLHQEATEKRQPIGILLNALPDYSLLRLALPIVEQACRQIGRCFLFCQDDIQSDIDRETYARYARDLDAEIKRMAENRDDYFQLFWADRAITLAAYSGQAFLREGAAAHLPETHPPALALMLRLKTRLSRPRPLTFQPRPMTHPLKHREISRIKEGGFSGIYITRRQEDIGDIMLSEFVNPPLVLADRLINNGYLALRRQAKREQLRDIMIVGLMPHGIKPRLSADFIKAAWLDFTGRFGLMLSQAHRSRSEFRWLEGDAFGRLRSCRFLLHDLPPDLLETPTQGRWQPSYRREFLTALGWLPIYLDTRGGFEDQGTQSPKQNALQWAFSVWRAQRENLLWTFHEQPGKSFPDSRQEKKLEIDRFAFIHIMLFLPAAKQHDGGLSAASRLGNIYSGLGIGGMPGRSVSITWVPEQITASRQWAVDCRGRHQSLLFPQEKTGSGPTDITGHHIASRLVETWRDRLIKELRNG
jgi:hypothetical protein